MTKEKIINSDISQEFTKASWHLIHFLDNLQSGNVIDGYDAHERETHPGTTAELKYYIQGVLFEPRFANRAEDNVPRGDFSILLCAHTPGNLSVLFKSIVQDPDNVIRKFETTNRPGTFIRLPLVFDTIQDSKFKGRLKDIERIIHLSEKAFEERNAKRVEKILLAKGIGFKF